MLRFSVSGVICLPLFISLVANPALVLAHAGHGNEFKGSSTTQTTGISVDQEVAKRLGLKVEAVKRQALKLAIKTTGQIETLPSQKAKVVTVISPIAGVVSDREATLGESVEESGKPIMTIVNDQRWLVIEIALGAIGGGAIIALAFWLGRRSGTKMVILREPSEELSKIGDRIER